MFNFDVKKEKAYYFLYSISDTSYILQLSRVQDFVKDIKISDSVYTRVDAIMGYPVYFDRHILIDQGFEVYIYIDILTKKAHSLSIKCQHLLHNIKKRAINHVK